MMPNLLPLVFAVSVVACVVAVVHAQGSTSSVNNALRRLFDDRLDQDGDGLVTQVELEAYYVSAGMAHHGTSATYRLLAGGAVAPEETSLSAPCPAGQTCVQTSDAGVQTPFTWADFAKQFARLDSTPEPFHPHEVHLALTGTAGEMKVMWVTTDNYMGTEASRVRWGCGSMGKLDKAASGVSYTYTVPKRWWGGFNGWIHEVDMTELTAAAVCFYQVGGITDGSGTIVWSDTFNFTAPAIVSPDQPTLLAIYGDQGTVMPLGFAVTDLTVHDNHQYAFDCVMHVGDISYAGTDTEIKFLNISKSDECEWIWDLYGDQIQPLASHMPYMTGVGNHEVFYNWTAFTHRYKMPTNGNGNFWFSYDIGNIHITSLSTEHPYEPGTPQHAWAAQDMAAAAERRRNGGSISWLVVTGHRPMYCSDASEWSQHRPGAPFQSSIEPLMLEYQVDLLITGHQHCLERIHPVHNGTVVSLPEPGTNTYVDPKAAVQVVVGTAGAMQLETFRSPAPAWSAYRNANNLNSYGYGRLQTYNSTHMHYVFSALSRNASVADEFWIVKSPKNVA